MRPSSRGSFNITSVVNKIDQNFKIIFNKQNPLGLWDQVYANIPARRYTYMRLYTLVTMNWFYAKRQTKGEKSGRKR